jgi:hypothetical protein
MGVTELTTLSMRPAVSPSPTVEVARTKHNAEESEA